MNFPQHAKAGFYTSCLAASAGYLFKDLRIALLAGLLCFVGSVIPDLDTDSIPSRWAARFGLGLTCFSIYTGRYFPAVVAALLFFAIKSFPHRNWTHKYFGPLICFSLGIYHQNFLYAAFGVGLLCHLLVDSLSPLDSRNWV